MKSLDAVLLILGIQAVGAFAEEAISLGSLPDEMVDPDGLARLPEPRPVKKLTRRSSTGNYSVSAASRGGNSADIAPALTPHNRYRTHN